MVSESNQGHDFDKLVTSNQFETRTQKIIKRNKLDPNVRLTWQNDDAEYAYTIWEWWRGRRYDIPCCDLALRIAVLSQTSSCYVERVFLRLKLVEDAVGENMKNDMLELRMFLQCNSDISELLDGLTMVTVSQLVMGNGVW